MALTPVAVPLADARRIWLRAQRLDTREPFGAGPAATLAAIEHLGYVQIDTINVIERSHHHILYSRIPAYARADLSRAQSVDKTVFEYWTHALSYVPVRDFRFFASDMKAHRLEPTKWGIDTDSDALAKLKRQIRRDGPVSIRDIEEEPVEKLHLWASKKPSKRVLEHGFYNGEFAIAARDGMVKTYDLIERHFGWRSLPRGATASQVAEYKLDRALRAQGLVNGASVMHPWKVFSPELAAIVERRVRRKELVPVALDDEAKPWYATPETLDTIPPEGEPLVHILSPFDPLIIQRARLSLYFGYDHIFEAYVPKAKRQYGYFTLPVLVGDRVAALLDLKADRAAGKLLVQAWHWRPDARRRADKPAIEAELGRFERFQLGV
jgi:uncharacterized protein YcaQ